jgi:hypothetical protein
MKIIQHLSTIAIITVIVVLIYASVQQTYRSNANDPQIQVLHDLKDHLQKGKPVESMFLDTIDLETSLSMFVETYDAGGKPIQSNGYLNGQLPQLPAGVMDNAKNLGENWVTWQPQKDVRMAMGITKVSAGPVSYVAVGRSLRETEDRVARLSQMLFAGWILTIAIALINWLVDYYQFRKKQLV